jgi:hypothetical protein
MEGDYPAAHSMDTTWFAIDARGQIAAFETGEPGHIPDTESYDLFDTLYTLYFGPYDWDANDGWDPEEWARRLGITFYSYPDDYSLLVLPYERTVQPTVPLHVDQLPPGMREKCRAVHFDQLRFDQTETVQPLEFFPCVYWDESDRPAYLAADGVTIRSVPGREGEFAEFVRRFQEEAPDEAAQWRFEGQSK